MADLGRDTVKMKTSSRTDCEYYRYPSYRSTNERYEIYTIEFESNATFSV